MVIHPGAFLVRNVIYDHDIALIELYTSVAIGRRVNHYSVNSICLPTQNYTLTDSPVYGLITGWGSVNDKIVVWPRHLQMAWVTFTLPEQINTKIKLKKIPPVNGSAPCRVCINTIRFINFIRSTRTASVT